MKNGFKILSDSTADLSRFLFPKMACVQDIFYDALLSELNGGEWAEVNF
jgi:hypothetical protein